LFARGDVLRFELPPPSADKPNIARRTWTAIRTWFNRGDLPIYRELGPEGGRGYQEVARSLEGQNSSMVRVNERGAVIVSVAVPVQHFRAVRGALMLTTQGDDIDQMVGAERWAILKIGGVASAVMIVLFAVAGEHDRRPGAAARRRRRARPPPHSDPREISRFHARRDEIGHLSARYAT